MNKPSSNEPDQPTPSSSDTVIYREPGKDALRLSEERFRIVLDSVPTVSVQGYAPDGTVLYWNKASEDLYGYTAEEAIGRSLLDLIIPPQDRETVQQNVLNAVQMGHTIPAGELVLQKKDGSPVAVYSSHACVTRVDGQVEMYCFDIDLTEQKRVERELQERSSRASAQRAAIGQLATSPSISQGDFETAVREFIRVTALTLDVARAGVWMFDKDQSALHCLCVYDVHQDDYVAELPIPRSSWPRYFETLLKDRFFTSSDTRTDPGITDTCSDYLQSRQVFAILDSAIIVSGEVMGVLCIENTGTSRTWHADEESFARMVAAMVGEAFLNADVKRLSGELQQAQKMDSIGRLAGGIAHDFNNLLGVILGHSQLALEFISDPHPAKEELDGIVEATKRSADLTRQLLAFARRQVIEPRPISLNEVVADMLSLLKSLIGKQVQLVWEPGSGDSTILADRTQIDQLLTNLCVNARDALGVKGGTIHVQTSATVLTEDDIASRADMVAGRYVVLEVRDSGCGMDQDTLDHLFEPFYTTKAEGKGTGLGLSTVYGIVRQNHGQIDVESTLGKGTCFRVCLPCFAA